NNTARLSQISVERANTPSYRIADLSDLNLEWLKGVETVAITAGASTPTPITKEVIDFLEAYDELDASTWDTTSHITSDKVLFKRK
ncbi:MAG: 4-hydroxy-3-methylbut-2-enyl diphosphate reductase, partial [Turicibacter sanguinis]